jgi:hypothetical protein
MPCETFLAYQCPMTVWLLGFEESGIVEIRQSAPEECPSHAAWIYDRSPAGCDPSWEARP